MSEMVIPPIRLEVSPQHAPLLEGTSHARKMTSDPAD
jgi:hypothetical protein